MFIHEIKNIVVDGDVVNGLAIKSSYDEEGESYKTYTVAEAGDKIGLIYATKNDEDELDINYEEEYTVEFNEDAEKEAQDVYIFAFCGEANVDGKEVKGLFFKPVDIQADYDAPEKDEKVVVIAEAEDGEFLDSPEISVGTITDPEEEEEEQEEG